MEKRARAEEAARQVQAANELAEMRVKQLEEISAGRVEGVDPQAETEAVSDFTCGPEPIEDLQAGFDWVASNLRPGEPLGWSVVSRQWQKFFFARLRSFTNSGASARPAARRVAGADRRSVPRVAFTDSVGKTIV